MNWHAGCSVGLDSAFPAAMDGVDLMAHDVSPPGRPESPLVRRVEAPFHALHREVSRLFDDVLRGRLADAVQAGLHPAAPITPVMDVSSNDQAVRVTVELPGIDSNDIDITLDGDLLTIRAEKTVDSIDPGDSYHVVERSYGKVQRTVRLPCAVMEEGAQARFDNGVLTVTLPRTPRQAASRKIPIGAGQAVAPTAPGPKAAR